MCTHIWWQQIEKYVGQPLANESLCALVSDSPGWIRFAAMSSHIPGWCFSRHLLPLFAMLVFPVCVALTLSSRREGPCVSAQCSVPSAPLTASPQWPDGWMKGEPCLLLHLFSVHVAWQSSLTPRHWRGGGHFFYCQPQKIPRLGLQSSNFKYSTDVNCVSDAVTFFLHAASGLCNRERAPLC